MTSFINWIGSHWKVSGLIFATILVSVSSVYAYLNLFRAESSSTPDSYVFYLWNDYIRNGTPMCIEISFDWQAENLSMTVTVNDDEYNKADYLGVVFDKNKNGIIDFGLKDEPYVLYVNNMTRPKGVIILQEHGGLNWPYINKMPSRYHVCTFDEQVGYTFKISLPREFIKVEPPTPIHICFVDYERGGETGYSNVIVWVQFKVT